MSVWDAGRPDQPEEEREAQHAWEDALDGEGYLASVRARFWAAVDRSGDGCWEWTGRCHHSGYGNLFLNEPVLGLATGMVTTHRISWVLHHGAIPDGLWVLHRCDNRPCCNPAHLFLGTALDNNRDREAKGRSKRWNAGNTHCSHGHEYTEANTYRSPSGWRRCRECMRLSWEAKKHFTGIQHGKETHCPRGHEYNETNTWRCKDGARRCRACNRASARTRRRSVAAR